MSVTLKDRLLAAAVVRRATAVAARKQDRQRHECVCAVRDQRACIIVSYWIVPQSQLNREVRSEVKGAIGVIGFVVVV